MSNPLSRRPTGVKSKKVSDAVDAGSHKMAKSISEVGNVRESTVLKARSVGVALRRKILSRLTLSAEEREEQGKSR